MALFHAFHGVSFKLAKEDGSLLVLRDQPTDYRGQVWFLAGEIPASICRGGKDALAFVKEHGKPIAVLGIVEGEATIMPPMIYKKVEHIEQIADTEIKNSVGEVTSVATREVKTEVEVSEVGTLPDAKVQKACHKLFDKMDIIEQTRFCSLEQIMALEVSSTIKETVTEDTAKDENEIVKIRSQAVKGAATNVKKQLSSMQRDLLQKRLGANGTVQKMIEAE